MKFIIFNESHGYLLARWFTDPVYVDFFRSFTTVPSIDDFLNWPKYTNQVIYTITENGDYPPIGFAYAYNFHSINRSCQAGIVLDKPFHGKHLGRKLLIEWYQYCIKRFGIRKIIAVLVNKNLVEGLKTMGFHEEGVRLRECYIDGIFKDEYRLGLFVENLKGDLCQQPQQE